MILWSPDPVLDQSRTLVKLINDEIIETSFLTGWLRGHIRILCSGIEIDHCTVIKSQVAGVISKQYERVFTIREGLVQKKKSVKFHTQGGGQDKIGSFSHFFYFFFFHVLNHANLQRNFFLVWGGGYPLS